MDNLDTIVAISTPLGEGGIGILRLSGKEAIKISAEALRLSSGEELGEIPSHNLKLGYVIRSDTGERIDQVLVSVMRAPSTYTREDIVEVNCHGGIVPLRAALEALVEAGARLAEPGEFTKRAFLNGRIDLAQAEAVVDIIRSKTDEGLKIAMGQLEGRVSEKVSEIKKMIFEVVVQAEASIDFADEDIETMSYKDMGERIEEARREIEKLIRSADTGRAYREGVRVAIAGRPNVGKSSLLNALVKETRVIVTSVPGTTRDVVEETINIKGVPFKLRDTAGIRPPGNEVERIGVGLSRKEIRDADVVLLVLDASTPLAEEDIAIAEEAKERKTVAVLNKTDLPQKIEEESVIKKIGKEIVKISATEEEGLEDLERVMLGLVLSGDVFLNGEAIVANVRHKKALEKARDDLLEAERTIRDEIPEEFVVTLLHDALDSIGEVTGETVKADLLSKIFSQFCIGK